LLPAFTASQRGFVFFFELHDRGVRRRVGKTLEDVDEDGVGFGDVEADVGDLVGDQRREDGEDGGGEDAEGEGWG
jgi:hypothetical protein